MESFIMDIGYGYRIPDSTHFCPRVLQQSAPGQTADS